MTFEANKGDTFGCLKKANGYKTYMFIIKDFIIKDIKDIKFESPYYHYYLCKVLLTEKRHIIQDDRTFGLKVK